MNKTILLSMDGSEHADETIRYASSVYPTAEVGTALLHVKDNIPEKMNHA